MFPCNTSQDVKTAKPTLLLVICTLFLYGSVLQLFLPSLSLAAQNQPQHESEAQLAALKNNISKINSWLSTANTEKTGLSKQLEKQDKEINSISRDIRFSNAKIAKHVTNLKSLSRLKKEQTATLLSQKNYLIKQIQTAYKHGEPTELKLLLDTDNPQDFARQMRYFSYLNEARKEKIKAFNDTLTQIKQTENKSLLEKKGLSEQKFRLEKNREQLKEQRRLRNQVLVKLESRIKDKSLRLKKMKADQQRLSTLLNELEAAIANIPLPSDASPFYKQKNKLPWPSHGKVLARFGSRIAQGKLKLNGIRISTKENDQVKSIHYGRVIFSNWIRGFGLLIIIDHGDNYMSLYGNNKSLLKETGDWVRAGETIAYTHQSQKNKESGLYFEIRKKGQPQNPSLWLRK